MPGDLNRAMRCEVAAEKTGIEIDEADYARTGEFDDAVVESVVPAATSFPPIHPLSVIVVGALAKNGFIRAQ